MRADEEIGEFMSAAIQSVHYSGNSTVKSTHKHCSVSRQPILDSRGRVHAYELHFRGELVRDGVEASMNLFETAANFGLERPSELKKLTGNLSASYAARWRR